MRFPFLHTPTTFLKPSESKFCLPRNTEATGPSLFSAQAAWKLLQLQPPPSPSSLNLPIAPALEHGLAAGKQLHIEKMLPSPSNTKDNIMLNPDQTKEATSACPSHPAPCPCPLHMHGLIPNLPCICPAPAVREAAHGPCTLPLSYPHTQQTTDPHSGHSKQTVVVMQGKRQR